MGTRSVRRIQDSVHGLMEFRGMETIVVDVLRTPELQRLRKVRQLGLVHFVFPGAEHSRLTHCLGAAYLATRFGRQLRDQARQVFVPTLVPDEVAISDLALAGLLHDLGHGPMSHAWEREIVGDSFDRKAWATSLGADPNDHDLSQRSWHEIAGQGLLSWRDGQLHRLLEHHETGLAERLLQLIRGRYYLDYIPRLLSSDVDIDRADYIMRDTHNTGVAYGRFDLGWLLSTCTLGRTRDTRTWVVGFEERKAVRVIEQFLIARQALYDTVYHHKTVRCMEGMVALLLKRLRDVLSEGTAPQLGALLDPILRVMKGGTLGPEHVVKLDDFSLFVLIDTVAEGAFRDDTAQDLAGRLQARELFKIVPVAQAVLEEFWSSGENIEKVYDVVKRHVPGVAKYYVLLDRPKFTMFLPGQSQSAMLVDSNLEATRASEHPALRRHHGEERAVSRLFVVAPAVTDVAKLIQVAR